MNTEGKIDEYGYVSFSFKMPKKEQKLIMSYPHEGKYIVEEFSPKGERKILREYDLKKVRFKG